MFANAENVVESVIDCACETLVFFDDLGVTKRNNTKDENCEIFSERCLRMREFYCHENGKNLFFIIFKCDELASHF